MSCEVYTLLPYRYVSFQGYHDITILLQSINNLNSGHVEYNPSELLAVIIFVPTVLTIQYSSSSAERFSDCLTE